MPARPCVAIDRNSFSDLRRASDTMIFFTAIFMLPGILLIVVVTAATCYALPQVFRMPSLQRRTALLQLFLMCTFAITWNAASISFHVSAHNGGTTSHGYARNGDYVLLNHGVETHVTRTKWVALQRMEFWCCRVGGIACVSSMILMALVDRFARRQGWAVDNTSESVTDSNHG